MTTPEPQIPVLCLCRRWADFDADERAVAREMDVGFDVCARCGKRVALSPASRRNNADLAASGVVVTICCGPCRTPEEARNALLLRPPGWEWQRFDAGVELRRRRRN